MKYITTDKHPHFKKGILLTEKEYLNAERAIIDLPCLDNAIFNGYIKELQEPKWTDDDMRKFAHYFKRSSMNDSKIALIDWANLDND